MFRPLLFLTALSIVSTANAESQFVVEAEVTVTDYLSAQTFEAANATLTFTVDPANATELGAPVSQCTDLQCVESSQWQGGIIGLDYVLTAADGSLIAEGSLTPGANARNLAVVQQRDNLNEQPDDQTIVYLLRDTTADVEANLYVGWVGETLSNVPSAVAFPLVETEQNASVLTQFTFDLNFWPGGNTVASFETSGSITAISPPVSDDTDGDGFVDAEDACPTSVDVATVMVDGVDSRVPNILLGDGCTITDLMNVVAEETSSYPRFVREVTSIARELAKEGAIDRREKYKIIRAALKSEKRKAWKKKLKKKLKKLKKKSKKKKSKKGG